MWNLSHFCRSLSKIYSRQDQEFHAVPQDQTFQQAPEVPPVQFCQQAPRHHLLPVEHQHSITMSLATGKSSWLKFLETNMLNTFNKLWNTLLCFFHVSMVTCLFTVYNNNNTLIIKATLQTDATLFNILQCFPSSQIGRTRWIWNIPTDQMLPDVVCWFWVFMHWSSRDVRLTLWQLNRPGF